MGRSKRAYHFEPWYAVRSKSWESAFRCPPAVDDEDVIANWQAARDRAETNADWLIFGTGMTEPGVAWGLASGDPHVVNSEQIIAVRRNLVTDHPNPPDHEQVAARIVGCVNACAGILDPEATLAAVRVLLLEMAQGKADANDPRILGLMSRLHPSSQFLEQSQRPLQTQEPDP